VAWSAGLLRPPHSCHLLLVATYHLLVASCHLPLATCCHLPLATRHVVVYIWGTVPHATVGAGAGACWCLVLILCLGVGRCGRWAVGGPWAVAAARRTRTTHHPPGKSCKNRGQGGGRRKKTENSPEPRQPSLGPSSAPGCWVLPPNRVAQPNYDRRPVASCRGGLPQIGVYAGGASD
jgi:hypothetical protein